VKPGLLAAVLSAAAFLFAAFPAQPADAKAELRPWTGGPTPVLRLKDLEGASRSLEAYRGKVVILNFWATWCEPCREEMPSLNQLRKALEGKPVEMFAVNVGEGEARIAAFLGKVPLDFPVLLDADAQVSRAWKVRLMPTTFIIGTDGRVRYTYAGGRDWADESVRARVAALAAERTAR
jgi:thiol-disulfide isomerase/thioredoxin